MSIETLAKQIVKHSNNKFIFAVFDRDGTLVPINPNPEAAILSAEVLQLLNDLSSLDRTKVAILSARDMGQLLEDFKMSNLILAGNYGMEILLRSEGLWQEPKVKAQRQLLAQVKEQLENKISPESKVILEDHGLTLCLHWHLAPERVIPAVHKYVNAISQQNKGVRLRTLPTSYEFWLDIDWDKGIGLNTLVDRLKLDLDKYLTLYVGDSDSDEPAFKWVNDRKGMTFRVGKATQTSAQFTLESTNEVKELLALLTSYLNAV